MVFLASIGWSPGSNSGEDDRLPIHQRRDGRSIEEEFNVHAVSYRVLITSPPQSPATFHWLAWYRCRQNASAAAGD
jgi:hypothetical protein